jgi:septum formation protein
MSSVERILLVSGSPRRRELLETIEVSFDVYNADIDETRLPQEQPEAYAVRLAREKALAGIAARGQRWPALGADTIVLLDDEMLLKPVDRQDARRMLDALSGRRHQVISAVALATSPAAVEQCVNRSWVEMDSIPEAWLDHYCKLDEPMDKAGAYAIQGLAAQWVRRVEGSYSGVMGLPLFETARLLRQAGLALTGRPG